MQVEHLSKPFALFLNHSTSFQVVSNPMSLRQIVTVGENENESNNQMNPGKKRGGREPFLAACIGVMT